LRGVDGLVNLMKNKRENILDNSLNDPIILKPEEIAIQEQKNKDLNINLLKSGGSSDS
jgi:hypothetical protein